MGERKTASSAMCTLEVERRVAILEAMVLVLAGEMWDLDINECDLNEMVPSLMVTDHELTPLLRELSAKMRAAATSGADGLHDDDEEGDDDDGKAASLQTGLRDSRDDLDSGEGDFGS